MSLTSASFVTASVLALMSREALNGMVGKLQRRRILGPLGFELNKLRMVEEGVDGAWVRVGGIGKAEDLQRVNQTGQLMSSVSFLEASEIFHTFELGCIR